MFPEVQSALQMTQRIITRLPNKDGMQLYVVAQTLSFCVCWAGAASILVPGPALRLYGDGRASPLSVDGRGDGKPSHLTERGLSFASTASSALPRSALNDVHMPLPSNLGRANKLQSALTTKSQTGQEAFSSRRTHRCHPTFDTTALPCRLQSS